MASTETSGVYCRFSPKSDKVTMRITTTAMGGFIRNFFTEQFSNFWETQQNPMLDYGAEKTFAR